MFEPGSDVARRQIELAKNLQELHIIVFDKIKNQKYQIKGVSQNEMVLAPNCWVYSTRSFSKFLYPLDAARLGRFLVKRRGITDITCQDASLTAMAGVSLKKQFNVPLEIQVHEDIGSPKYASSIMRRIRKSMALSHLPKADKIRVVSERIKSYLVGTLGIDASKITVKPIAVDTYWIRSAPISVDIHAKYPQFKMIVLMASRLEPEKDIQLAIHSFKKVTEKIPKAGLVIVGSGSQRGKLEAVAQQLDLGEHVIFEPWADKPTLASYYKTADLFLVTSLFEGYGLTFVEAQAAGCPIISTDVGVAKESGAIIAAALPADIAEKVIHSLSLK
jgi:glycosyltransferase involved in cell wall biosynthesis